MLCVDARQMGTLVDRTHRELTEEDVARIADAYHSWRRRDGGYADSAGFCKSVKLEEVRRHDHVLTPARYVGAAAQEDDGEPFEKKIARLLGRLREQQAEARRIDAEINASLKELGYHE